MKGQFGTRHALGFLPARSRSFPFGGKGARLTRWLEERTPNIDQSLAEYIVRLSKGKACLLDHPWTPVALYQEMAAGNILLSGEDDNIVSLSIQRSDQMG